MVLTDFLICHASIVFSSWTKTLRLVSQLLQKKNLPHYYIHGDLNFAKRKQVLDQFQHAKGANILLMTLGTGAVGYVSVIAHLEIQLTDAAVPSLNLAIASRVYLLEPQWNPSTEQQAVGRALRLGQTKQVTLVRYIMKNTVEDVSKIKFLSASSYTDHAARAMFYPVKQSRQDSR